VSETPALELRQITKRFGTLVANRSVDFELRRGEIHALLGENGAGKSTLMNVLYGLHQPDEGQILLDGEPVSIDSPRRAIGLGIGMVYQHFTLVPCLTAAENLVISRADAPGIIDWSKEKKALESFMERMPFRVPLNAQVSSLSAGEKQKLEILN